MEIDHAAAAKSLQSCPTLCDPRDGSPPGSPEAERLLKVLWRSQREKASVKSQPEKHLLCGVG